jgi:hypothetical protein
MIGLSGTENGEATAEVVPESDAHLGAGLGLAKEGITAVATGAAAGATAGYWAAMSRDSFCCPARHVLAIGEAHHFGPALSR